MDECGGDLNSADKKDFAMSTPIRPNSHKGTHDDTATEVFGELEDTLGHARGEPAGAAGEDGEERTEHRADEDDEHRRDAQAGAARVAAARAAVERVVAGLQRGIVFTASEDHGRSS